MLMIKVLIADDHALFRSGLKQLLANTSDISVEAEASNGTEVLAFISQHDFDVILLDISMPGESGLGIIKRIKSVKPDQVILVVSMHPEEQYGIRVLRDGVSGYFNKEDDFDDLIKAIRKVADGGMYINAKLSEQLAMRLRKASDRPRHQNLSDREFQVMIMIASGKTLKTIAKELFLSPKTVTTYRARLLEKMQLKTNADLTSYAIHNELLA